MTRNDYGEKQALRLLQEVSDRLDMVLRGRPSHEDPSPDALYAKLDELEQYVVEKDRIMDRQRQTIESALEAMEAILLIRDAQDNSLLFSNSAAHNLWGADVEDFSARYTGLAGGGVQNRGVKLYHDPGNDAWYNISVSPIVWEDHEAYLYVFTDISVIKRRERSLREAAFIDKLTRVYNREAGRDFIRANIATLKPDGKLSLCFIDVDDLKSVNDNYGHEAGDELIVAVADVLVETLREEDMVCRVGGDEFVVALLGNDEAAANVVMSRVQATIEKLNAATHRPYAISFSYGIHVVSERDADLDEALRLADERMYQQKREKKRAEQA